MSDDGGDVSWYDLRETAPSWWEDLEALAPYLHELQDFAESPFAYVWELIIRGILYMWAGVLSYLRFVMRQAFLQPAYEITYALLGVITTLVSAYLGILYAIHSAVTAIAISAGIAAPVAVSLAWAVPMLLTAATLYVVIEIVSTYLPIGPFVDLVGGISRRVRR